MQDTRIIAGDARNIDISEFTCKYGVIVADPPWPYQQFSERKQGAASAEYNLMTMDELYGIPIKDMASEDSILLLWGTWPKLPEAVQTMNAWGFEYVTGFPWVKLNKNGNGIYYGIGFWVRGCSEFVLIGRRGNVSPPRLEGFLGLMSPNLKHSHKPEDIYAIAESLPGPYLELFSRRSRRGWHSFGNEVKDMETGATHTPDGIKIKNVQPQLFGVNYGH